MNKTEFSDALRRALGKLPSYEVEQSIAFYSEMIDDRVEDGMSEADAVAALGPVGAIAAQIIAETPVIPKAIAKANTGSRTLNVVLLVVFSPIWVPLVLALIVAALMVHLSIWMVIVALWATVATLLLCGPIGIVGLVWCLATGYPLTAAWLLGCGMAAAAPQGTANVTPQMQPVEYTNLQQITLDSTWEYADHSKINTGAAVLYRAPEESGRKGIVIGVNAGHGTVGGSKVKTLCHPDGSAKVTGGSTAAGAMEAAAVSGGMTFQDGTPEREVTLRMARILRDKLLSSGYDVLMLRDSEDVQLDNVARTVICNNVADCHIALHWDSGDGKNYDKGCFYISVPEALKNMEPVASHWQQHDTLGTDLVEGLREQGATIYGKGHMGIDLTQTSYSTIHSVDMELGNAYSDHSDVILEQLATGLLTGINTYFEQ